jgi:hypothetical protein
VGIAGTNAADDGVNTSGDHPSTKVVEGTMLLFYTPGDISLNTTLTDAQRATYLKGVGVMLPGEPTKGSQISDGTSNTLMIGERSGLAAIMDSAAPNYGSAPRAAYWTGSIRARWANSTLSNVRNDAGFLINGTNAYGTSSMHTGGGHFARADGSTAFVNDSIDGTVWEALGTRGGDDNVSGG